MKKVKSFFKKISSIYCRYVNGVKGSVSIFLALVLSPMLSVSLLLVETSRIQNAVQALEDIMDAAGLSVIADFDPYIEDRFGLLATNQSVPVSDSFRSYMDTNLDLLGNDITAKGQATAEGKYALSDNAVLKRQILDYSEIVVPVEIAMEGLDISGKLKKLEKMFMGDTLTALTETVTKASDTASDVADLIGVVTDLYDGVQDYLTKKGEYSTSSNNFKSALDELRAAYEAKEAADAAKAAADAAKADADAQLESAKQTARDNESDNFVQDKVTDVGDSVAILQAQGKVNEAQDVVDAADRIVASAAQDVSSAKSNAVKKAKSYATDAGELAAAIETVVSKSESALNKSESVIRNLNETSSSLEEYNTAKANDKAQNSSSGSDDDVASDSTIKSAQSTAASSSADSNKFLLDVTEGVIGVIEKYMTAAVYDGMREDKEALLEQEGRLNQFTGNDITSSAQLSPVLGYMKSRGYEKKTIDTLPEGLAGALDKKAKELSEQTLEPNAEGTTVVGFMESLGTVIDTICGLTVFYDVKLKANTPNADSGAMAASDQLVISAINDLVQGFNDAQSAVNKLENGNLLGLWDIVKAIANLLEAIVEFIVALGAWVLETLCGIGMFLINLISDPDSVYEDLMICGYGLYNFPNRSNYNSGSSLTGTSYKKLFKWAEQASSGGNSAYEMQSLKQLQNKANGNISFGSAGQDPLFYGAVAEYLLVGSPCERSNQMATFFNLYMFRMVMDIFPLLSCQDVQYAASLAGPFSWAVLLVCILVEPMIDTLLLVNGAKQPLWKYRDGIYCSYTGLIKLPSEIAKLTDLPGGMVDDLTAGTDKILKDWGVGNSGFLELAYTEHLLLLMLGRFTGDSRNQTVVKRISNVINLECREKYSNSLGTAGFDMGKTYTCIEGKVPYTSHPLFRFDILPNGGEFNASVTRYIGY